MIDEDFKLYLPKFLTAETNNELLNQIRDFSSKKTGNSLNYYTEKLKNESIIFQGDGISKMPVINLPEIKVHEGNVIIFSNTCDIDINNHRLYPTQLVYAPIFNLEKYRIKLIENTNAGLEKIENHIQSIKNQEITQIIYLPKYNNLDESIIFLDRVINYPVARYDINNLKSERLFTLSNFGLYLFVLKLSIHFTRIQDKVER